MLGKHCYVLCCHEEVCPSLGRRVFMGGTEWLVAMVMTPETISLVKNTTEVSVKHGESAHADCIVAAFASAEGVLGEAKILPRVAIRVALCSRTIAKEGLHSGVDQPHIICKEVGNHAHFCLILIVLSGGCGNPVIVISMHLRPDVVLRSTSMGCTPGNLLEVRIGSDKTIMRDDEAVGTIAATGAIHFIHEIGIQRWWNKVSLKCSGGSLCWTTIHGAAQRDALAVVVNREGSASCMSSGSIQMTGMSWSKG
eukprot:9399876-Ditylum_brightwellii.AAC.1